MEDEPVEGFWDEDKGDSRSTARRDGGVVVVKRKVKYAVQVGVRTGSLHSEGQVGNHRSKHGR